MGALICRLPAVARVYPWHSAQHMNDNSNGVTVGDIVFLALCILGLLTGLAGIITLTAWAGVLGFAMLLAGLAYFGMMQAVDA